jgi:hypothetical protein
MRSTSKYVCYAPRRVENPLQSSKRRIVERINTKRQIDGTSLDYEVPQMTRASFISLVNISAKLTFPLT